MVYIEIEIGFFFPIVVPALQKKKMLMLLFSCKCQVIPVYCRTLVHTIYDLLWIFLEIKQRLKLLSFLSGLESHFLGVGAHGKV
jgi:hypothetical protein